METTSLTRWCFACRTERQITLPGHPSGLGACQTCGTKIDLADFPAAEVREYLDQYYIEMRSTYSMLRLKPQELPTP